MLCIFPPKGHAGVSFSFPFFILFHGEFDVSSTVYIYSKLRFITKTRLYNFDPLKPHFYIVKLGFTGVYIIFFISAQKHRLWYSLEPPRGGGSNEYPQSMFWAEIWKISEFFIWKFSVFGGEIFYIFEKACFRNGSSGKVIRPIYVYPQPSSRYDTVIKMSRYTSVYFIKNLSHSLARMHTRTHTHTHTHMRG